MVINDAVCVYALMDRLDYRVSPHILTTPSSPSRSNHCLSLWRDHGFDHQPCLKSHNNTSAKAWPLIGLIFSTTECCDEERFTSEGNDGIESDWWPVEVICFYFLSLSYSSALKHVMPGQETIPGSLKGPILNSSYSGDSLWF